MSHDLPLRLQQVIADYLAALASASAPSREELLARHPDLADELRAMLRALAGFDPRTPFLAPEQSRDLLKKLYQYLVPKKLRHDLGEYYTPDWLADHLLTRISHEGCVECGHDAELGTALWSGDEQSGVRGSDRKSVV